MTTHKPEDIREPAEVAAAWERWCGETSWSRTLRQFGELGGKIIWWGGYPQSASAIPLCFVLLRPDGSKISGSSRLRDLRDAHAALTKACALMPEK